MWSRTARSAEPGPMLRSGAILVRQGLWVPACAGTTATLPPRPRHHALATNLPYGFLKRICFNARGFPHSKTRKGHVMTRIDPSATATPSTGMVDAATALQVRKTIYGHDRLTPTDMDIMFEVAQRREATPVPSGQACFARR